MGKLFGIVWRAIAADQVRKAGDTHCTVSIGAINLIQHFGDMLNFNIHLHALFLNVVYVLISGPSLVLVIAWFWPVFAVCHSARLWCCSRGER